ncbi:hypothetical protein QGM71_15480 [Virgibacillus sp. C22-A2]|uniref:DUF3993 domain-containing protein n=1 Tax=Virgibacillus tibetensis TaxID=3042313 RepID=A0ABU6KHU9_9BACI|nr:hypothetical protein [Virgibacillus sp. C22-A2]
MKDQQRLNIKWVIIFMTLISLLTISNASNSITVSAEDQVQGEEVSEEETPELTHEKLVFLTDQFMKLIVQEIDDNYKVKDFDTKESLLHAFERVTTRDVAEIYVDFYFTEEPDGLYILPTETPPWFMKDNAYDMIQVEENVIKITQENHLDLYGDYRVEIELTFDEEWKITNIKHA